MLLLLTFFRQFWISASVAVLNPESLPFFKAAKQITALKSLEWIRFCLTMLENQIINYEACAGFHGLGRYREYGETFVPLHRISTWPPGGSNTNTLF
jgi:hypothetical protein